MSLKTPAALSADEIEASIAAGGDPLGDNEPIVAPGSENWMPFVVAMSWAKAAASASFEPKGSSK